MFYMVRAADWLFSHMVEDEMEVVVLCLYLFSIYIYIYDSYGNFVPCYVLYRMLFPLLPESQPRHRLELLLVMVNISYKG
jgi:hypothetical protein